MRSVPDEDESTRLQTGQLLLRRLLNEDAPVMARYLSDWDVVKQTTSVPYPYDERLALSWIARSRNRQVDGLEHVFAMTKRDEEQLIGTVALGIIEHPEGARGEIGYWLGKPYWGFGFASEAVHAMTGFAFDTVGITHIDAAVFKDNIASARVLEKSGYSLDRTEVRKYPDRGGRRKVLFYTIHRNKMKVDIP